MKVKTITSSDTTRSYASEANLEKGITKLGLDSLRYITCRTKEGRWTAIFSYNDQSTLYISDIISSGFMLFN